MIDWQVATYGLDPRDAYVLCSVSVDLHVSQLVNDWPTVSAFFPTSVMPG
jgi:acetamidase/formamidase